MPSPTTSSAWSFVDVSGDNFIDSLVGGTKWDVSVLKFSFANSESYWSTSSSTGYGPSTGDGEPWNGAQEFSESDKVATRAVLASWAAVANLRFAETTESSTSVGDLRFAYTSAVGEQAHAYLPSSSPKAGDVWINANSTSATNEWAKGTYYYETVIHEVGHALGLKHSFEASGANGATLDADRDSRLYTVMSYSAEPGNQASHFNFEPTTPMVIDIAAIQYIYGANMTWHAGNDTYTFKGTSSYNQTLWDAGGIDTIIYSSTKGGTIDLAQAHGSQMGNDLHSMDAYGNILGTYKDVWIAADTVIENATGGSGSDEILGNSSSNVLLGMAGNDTLTGGAGNDKLNGGGGIDRMIGGSGNDIYYVDSASDVVIETVTSTSQIDTVYSSVSRILGANQERLVLTGSAVNGTGNASANLITGDAAANTLSGLSGNDTLFGAAGNDVLTGGSGLDTFRFAWSLNSTSNADRITDFSHADDRFQLDDSYFEDIGAVGLLASGAFRLGTAAGDSSDRVIYDSGTGHLFYDADGTGGAGKVLFATVTAHASITAADFYVI